MKNLILLFVLLFALPASAATYHVAKTGSDAITCANADFTPNNTQAKLTVQAGVDCLTSAGDILIVHVGTYTETVIVGSSGSSGGTLGSNPNVITIKAQPGDTVTLTNADTNPASYNGAITIIDKSYVRVEGFRFAGSRSKAAFLMDSYIANKTTNPMQGLEVINNSFEDNGWNGGGSCEDSYVFAPLKTGMAVAHTGSPVNLFQGNTFTANFGYHIVLSDASDWHVTGNSGTGAKGSCAVFNGDLYTANYVFLGTDENFHNLIENNTFSDFNTSITTDIDFAFIRGDSGAEQNIIRNNVLHGNLYGQTWNSTQFAYGILLESRLNSNLVQNNIVYDINVSCLTLSDPTIGAAENNIIDGNVFYNCGKYGIDLSQTENTTVKNNIIMNAGTLPSGGAHVIVSPESVKLGGNTFSNNLYYKIGATNYGCWSCNHYDTANLTFAGWVSASGESSSLNVDPLFVSAGSDFHLTASSPACGTGLAGINIGAYPTPACTGSGATVTEDQEIVVLHAATTGNLEQAFVTPPTAGCTMVVAGSFVGRGMDMVFSSPAVADTDLNSYIITQSSLAGRQIAMIAVADNISVTAPYTVKIQVGASFEFDGIAVYKSFCGLANPATDKTATAADPGPQASDATVSTAATAQANETIIAALGLCAVGDTNLNISIAGYTETAIEQDCSLWQSGGVWWKNVSATGVQTATWSHDDVTGSGTYNGWAAAMVTLKDAVPGGVVAATRRRFVVVQ